MLGDLGAYALGALVVLVAFNLFDEQGVSPFFLASLLCYPCVELLRIMAVRQSPEVDLTQLKAKRLIADNTLHTCTTLPLIFKIKAIRPFWRVQAIVFCLA